VRRGKTAMPNVPRHGYGRLATRHSRR
jgi:hypothetical protein